MVVHEAFQAFKMRGPNDANATESTLPTPAVTLHGAGFGLVCVYLTAEGGKHHLQILKGVNATEILPEIPISEYYSYSIS